MSDIKINSIIKFGNYDWLVLDVQDGNALIISNNIIEQRGYNVKRKNVTWEKCTLRKYLNGEFFKKFSASDRKRILETQLSNNNTWVSTNSGKDTSDKIFLLSLEEADKYFGNTGDYKNVKRVNGKGDEDIKGHYLSNDNDNLRIAKFEDKPFEWWLRSLGGVSDAAAFVEKKGFVFYNGNIVNGMFGVRPALRLKL